MNRTKNIILGLGTLALVIGISGAVASTADAYRGDPSVRGPYYSTERHEAMEKALETNNYTAWKNLMPSQGRVTQVITEENFAKFAEAHRLAEKGDLTGAQKIRQELGLGLRNGAGVGMRSGSGFGPGMGNCINK